jgi:hypothetical protein
MNQYLWTQHSQWKMKQYGLSQQRLKRVIRKPDRIEKSIVPGMIASMQIGGTSKHRQEIWIMYQLVQNQKNGENVENFKKSSKEEAIDIKKQPFSSFEKTLSPVQKFREERRKEFFDRYGQTEGKTFRIISAWKYPGKSSARDPIPREILDELLSLE